MDENSSGIPQPALAQHDSRLLDLAFAMDTTGSMGSYIDTARNNIRQITEDIVAKESSDVRLALVEYRDPPPRTFVTRVHNFTPKVARMKHWLEASSAPGGGDGPEAVADALHDVLNLSWRKEATKICVLVSDAPPRGLSRIGDKFANSCPLGHDPMAIARQLAENGVTLYVAGCEPALNSYKDFFAAMAHVTGGQYVPLSAASALTEVIVGGAQEELSLEQFMEQVNQRVLQEVQTRGRENINVDLLSRDVMGSLNMQGARSKHLRVNQAPQAAPSAYVQNMSNCADMAAVRSEWNMSPAPTRTPMSVDDAPMSSGLLAAPPAHSSPMTDVTPSAFHSRGAPPQVPTEYSGDSASAMPVMQRSAAASNSYDVGEGEIQMGQAHRMVQKALMRNNKK